MVSVPVPTPVPYPAPTPVPTPPVVQVPVVMVSSNMQMSGVSKDEFNTPENTAAFARDVEDSLTVDAVVTNVVASDVARRRLARRQLLQSGVDVSYDLQMAIGGMFGSCGINSPIPRIIVISKLPLFGGEPIWHLQVVLRQPAFSVRSLRTSRQP